MKRFSLSIPFLLLLLFLLDVSHGVVFDTYSGQVRGVKMNSRGGREFLAFRGIPYAKPPVGDLRFKSPVPADKWSGVLDATEDANICPQKNVLFTRYPEVEGSEDCLYINVYTPLKSQNTKKKYPVMVNFHYGGFFLGSSKSTLTGPNFFMDKDIVLVTFNYRLGVFGFYSTLDDSSWGNWGLKDQVLALKWVRSNIDAFGGDPNAVTTFGQSAGGASAHYHMLSPSSRGLFQRSISQSGTALPLWAKPLNELQRVVYKQLADFAGCNGNETTKKVVECMRTLDFKTLIEAQDKFKYFQVEPINVFSLVIENKTANNPDPFITMDPSDIIRSGDFARVPWINGVVANDGILRAAPLLRQSDTAAQLNENFDVLMPNIMGLASSVPQDRIPEVWQSIKDFYLKGANKVNLIDTQSVQGFTDLLSDRVFVYGTYQTVMLHSLKKHRPIWFYQFDYRGRYTFGDVFAVTNETIPVEWGTSHCDELIYMFDSPDLPFGKLTGDDLYMSRLLIQMWTDFAKNKEPLEGWAPIQAVKKPEKIGSFRPQYLRFPEDGFQLEMRNDFLEDRMRFWQSLPLYENIPEIA